MSERLGSYRRDALCEMLRDARKAKGWNQGNLGRRIGISAAQMSRIERDRSGLTVSRLVLLCGALEIEPLILPRETLFIASATVRLLEADAMARNAEALLSDLSAKANVAAVTTPSSEWLSVVDLLESLRTLGSAANRAWMEDLQHEHPKIASVLDRTHKEGRSRDRVKEWTHRLRRLLAGLDPIQVRERAAYDPVMGAWDR